MRSARGLVAEGRFSRGASGPDAEVERSRDRDGRIPAAWFVVNRQLQHVPIEFHRGIDIVDNLCNRGYVPDHASLPSINALFRIGPYMGASPYFSIRRRAMMSFCISFVPSPIIIRGASR